MVCLVLALLLYLNAMTLAEYVPSKTTGDMTQIVVSAESAPVDAAPYVIQITEAVPEYQEIIAVHEEEINKLAVTPVTEYFTEVKDADGNTVDLTTILNMEEPKVYSLYLWLQAIMMKPIIIVRMLINDTYKSAEDIRRYTGLVMLAMIPVEEQDGNNKRHKKPKREA